MKTWLLSIVGIIFLGVVVEIIMPDGKNSVFIKHIFSIFMLFVIVAPLKSVFTNNKIDTSVSLDTNYLYKTNLEKIEYYEKSIIDNLNNVGFDNCSVIINSNIFEDNLKIDSVYVDVTNSKNINSCSVDEVKNIVIKIVNINKEGIVVYGFKN